MNTLFLDKRRRVSELCKKQHKRSEIKRVKQLEKEIGNINNSIKTKKPKKMIKNFFDLVMRDDYSVILFLLLSKLRKINEDVQRPLRKRLEDFKAREIESGTPQKKQKLKAEIKIKMELLDMKSLGSTVSLEVFFRNLFP